MRVLSPTASRLDHIICPFCESGSLVSRGPGFAEAVPFRMASGLTSNGDTDELQIVYLVPSNEHGPK
jgi:hypothetical protein